MNKKSSAIKYLLLCVLFICIAGCLAAVLYFKTDPTVPAVIAVVCVIAVMAILMKMNYRHSAYGGKFEERYPNGKA